jgi:hypothetical protein
MTSIRYNIFNFKKKLPEESKTDHNVIDNLLYEQNEKSKESPQRSQSQAGKRAEHYKKIRDRHNPNRYSNIGIGKNEVKVFNNAQSIKKTDNKAHRPKTSERVGMYSII